MGERRHRPQAVTDLSRCSWCGRTGTLTSLSAGNRCELQDDCDTARHEALNRVGNMRLGRER